MATFFTNLKMTLNTLNNLAKNLLNEGLRLDNAIEPRMPLLFEALELVNPKDVKVVILGQDPTPQKGKATGVAFHVNDPRSVPAVLHMFLEVAFEGFPVHFHEGDVTKWAKQGVLLLNTALTCPHNLPKGAKNKAKYKSHFGIWKKFTISLIRYIGGEAAEPSVWLLWGRKAKDFSKHIDEKHLIIEGGHPSPTGTAKHGDSFFGRNYFNIANEFLLIKRRGAIDWSLSSTGRDGFNLEPLLETKVVLQQRMYEEQQLRNQHLQNQHLIYSIEQKITEKQQEQQKILHHLQSIVNALHLSQPQRSELDEQLKTLKRNYDLLENEIQKYREQLEHLKIQQSQIEEKLKQNLTDQHYLKGLPGHLLKHNYQNQIIVIDKELNS